MAQKNNKGFSLVEVVIAVAILSILLSPILIQLVQSLKTSAEAKEKQYAVEGAESVLEYYQKTELDQIGKDGYVNITSMVNHTGDANSIVCKLVSTSNATLATVKYSATDYGLSDVMLGKYKNVYKRTVTVDDLSNKVLEAKCRIKYDFTDAEVSLLTNGTNGFTHTNEGNLVKYDSDGHVIEVVCSKLADTFSYVDPNSVSLGFIQNLDANTVAIIQGVASNFDSQAEDDFYSLKMQHLKDVNYPAWQQAMNHVNGENIFSSNSFSETTNKLTVLKTEAIKDGETVKYYQVTCDVYYTDKYSIPMSAGGIEAENDKLTYNVFAQKFYTEKAPDIYFVYEPFVDLSNSATAQYAATDYIAVDNDADTSDSKIYLIKPDNSQLSVKMNNVGTSLNANCGDNAYYTRATGSWKQVNINVFRIGSNMTASELKIFTNLSLEDSDSFKNQMFLINPPAASLFTDTELSNRLAYSTDDIKQISDDTRVDGRLYTATVTLKRIDSEGNEEKGYEIKLQGGKGAD